jgi:hypothetical protein
MIGILIWYGIGLPGAFLARYALNKGIYDGHPLTWGSLVVCLIAGVGGPITVLCSVVWFCCYIAEGRAAGFWSQSVFRQRDDQ